MTSELIALGVDVTERGPASRLLEKVDCEKSMPKKGPMEKVRQRGSSEKVRWRRSVREGLGKRAVREGSR